jgi:2Fe-2S ferredoxin
MEEAMATVKFITHDGEAHETALVEGESLMQLAMNNGIPGIDADCGGEAACGTCHVIVDEQWAGVSGRCNDAEEQMLGMNEERQPTSRLSCQIALTREMDGLAVHLPEFQF